ncbi:glycosyltransferase [Novipirellula artificiosorum]|uniref:Poly-beta-1,6-N-acetyl-D-glucosamine synthase n=1 Tax=Novipirellula artificiosorum TaxID=2528016 RepID=A0A5C6DUY1_9BACT|nr:glycosyltransferase [Novipirellula artificiosorum]TWU40468.1 Poly-beta-1,6-N-acetyl-D-glucosamine synthase [Novipirellula artificiosorum]
MHAIVIPCFNEAMRFQEEPFAIALSANPKLHLCLVNDGSTDETERVLQAFCDKHNQRTTLISYHANRGKAEAVRAGILSCADQPYEQLGYWDADLATPIEDLPLLVNSLNHDPSLDMVLGSRVRMLGHQIERRMLRHYVGRAFATLASLSLDLPVYDTQCGAKVFRNAPWTIPLFQSPFVSGWAFDIELLSRYLVHCKQAGHQPKLLEVPLRQWHDVAGSKVSPIDGIKASAALLRLARSHRKAMRCDSTAGD